MKVFSDDIELIKPLPLVRTLEQCLFLIGQSNKTNALARKRYKETSNQTRPRLKIKQMKSNSFY